MSIPQSGGATITDHAQLADYLTSGCKPRDQWRIGTEHEKFGYCADTLRPLPYDGERSIHAVLSALRDRFGWAPVEEQGKLIGLTKDGANVSLEPGGQLELSGAPVETIHHTCDEVNDHLREVKAVSDEIGVHWIGLGAAPIWTHDDMPLMPKGRYELMDSYMGRVGTMGRIMMRRTCTVQVNVDFASEADMVRKLRVAMALQSVATALFANSPFLDGAPNGHRSFRSRVWRDLDAARTGIPEFVFEDGFGFERWVDYALDVPMYFVHRDGTYIDALGMSFRDFLRGELPALPGELPTTADWADHLTTLFPEARIKKYMEMRGADGGPWRRLCALPAFWVGLMYDDAALEAAWDLCKRWDHETRLGLRVAASERALEAEFGGVRMADLARECVGIAEEGLKRRARPGAGGLVPDETHFLNALHDTLETGRTLADEMLAEYEGAWAGDLSRVYAERSY